MTYFISTEKFVDTKGKTPREAYEILKKAYIPEYKSFFPDFESLTEDDRILPIPTSAYPHVVERMTASSAGKWAMERCKSENEDCTYSNIRSWLCTLEMDLNHAFP
jgi:hypothetical protein